MNSNRVTAAEIRDSMNAIAVAERPDIGRASPAVLEMWRAMRPDLTLEQFLGLVARGVAEHASRQRQKAIDRMEARKSKLERRRKKADERRRTLRGRR